MSSQSESQVLDANCLPANPTGTHNLGGESGACSGGYTGDKKIRVTESRCTTSACQTECSALSDDGITVEVAP